MSWPLELSYSLAPGKNDCERCQGTGEIVTDWEAYLGDAEGDGLEACPDCNGSGDSEGGDPPCTDCGGTGITYQTERRCACKLTDEEWQSWQDIREGMNR